MTRDKLKQLTEQWMFLYFTEVMKNAPHKTGNLKRNIVSYVNGNKFGLVIDVPYMKYTEEEWTYNSRWKKTLPNPNEKWLLGTVDFIIEQAKAKGGIVR